MGIDDVNTFYGDVIVAYPDLDVGNGIAQSVYYQEGTLKPLTIYKILNQYKKRTCNLELTTLTFRLTKNLQILMAESDFRVPKVWGSPTSAVQQRDLFSSINKPEFTLAKGLSRTD